MIRTLVALVSGCLAMPVCRAVDLAGAMPDGLRQRAKQVAANAMQPAEVKDSRCVMERGLYPSVRDVWSTGEQAWVQVDAPPGGNGLTMIYRLTNSAGLRVTLNSRVAAPARGQETRTMVVGTVAAQCTEFGEARAEPDWLVWNDSGSWWHRPADTLLRRVREATVWWSAHPVGETVLLTGHAMGGARVEASLTGLASSVDWRTVAQRRSADGGWLVALAGSQPGVRGFALAVAALPPTGVAKLLWSNTVSPRDGSAAEAERHLGKVALAGDGKSAWLWTISTDSAAGATSVVKQLWRLTATEQGLVDAEVGIAEGDRAVWRGRQPGQPSQVRERPASWTDGRAWATEPNQVCAWPTDDHLLYTLSGSLWSASALPAPVAWP